MPSYIYIEGDKNMSYDVPRIVDELFNKVYGKEFNSIKEEVGKLNNLIKIIYTSTSDYKEKRELLLSLEKEGSKSSIVKKDGNILFKTSLLYLPASILEYKFLGEEYMRDSLDVRINDYFGSPIFLFDFSFRYVNINPVIADNCRSVVPAYSASDYIRYGLGLEINEKEGDNYYRLKLERVNYTLDNIAKSLNTAIRKRDVMIANFVFKVLKELEPIVEVLLAIKESSYIITSLPNLQSIIKSIHPFITPKSLGKIKYKGMENVEEVNRYIGELLNRT